MFRHFLYYKNIVVSTVIGLFVLDSTTYNGVCNFKINTIQHNLCLCMCLLDKTGFGPFTLRHSKWKQEGSFNLVIKCERIQTAPLKYQYSC